MEGGSRLCIKPMKGLTLKTILRTLVALILLASPSLVQAQQVGGSVEYAHFVVDGESTPEIHTYLRGPIKGDFGWTSWTLNNGSWSEALIGLTYAPASWIEVSGSVGLERHDNSERFGASVWLGKGRFSLLSLFENGGSGAWQKYVGTFKVNKHLSVGGLSQDFLGEGPYFEVNVKKFTTWVTVVGKKSGAAGLKYNF